MSIDNNINQSVLSNEDAFVNDSETGLPNIIKVIGVGGGGCNAVNHMFQQHVPGVSYVVCNTDMQALNDTKVPNKLLLGPQILKGLGAGSKPEKAREGAEESLDEIARLFDAETKMVFITAGMGGGTGTGAGPVIAQVAREKGVLTIGIVTIPFLFEGKPKIMKALAGADEMSKYVDALLIINNERLTEIYADLTLINAFRKADDTLSVAASSISEIITRKGIINRDFNDVNTTLREGGAAIISTGYGEGPTRVADAIADALKSPLLRNRDVYGSKRILINLYVNDDDQAEVPFMMSEVQAITDFTNNFGEDVSTIWGVAPDRSLGNRVKVTVLAAGFTASTADEAPKAEPTANKPAVAPAAPVANIDRRLEEEYGQETIRKQNEEAARAKFIILNANDIDNDDLIEILEKTPTAKRDVATKQQAKDLQNGMKSSSMESKSEAGNNIITF